MKIPATLLAILALGTCAAHAATAPAAKAPTLGNWSVMKTYHADGPVTCVLRFPNAKGQPVLTLDDRKKGGATFTLSGLPPLLTDEKGLVKGIAVAIGSWSRTHLAGAWVHGSDDTNSRIVFSVDLPLAEVGPHVARGKSLTISFMLASEKHNFPFTLVGSVAPTAEALACD